MENTAKKHRLKTIAAAVAACIVLVGGGTAAYAADVGGIQRTVQLWMQGEQTDVTMEFDGKGNYEMDYVDEDGNTHSQSGGGVAIDFFGNERPLTEDELIEEMNSPEVAYLDDGSAWVYWYDQKIDITDKFEDDVCHVKLVNGDETLYMTVKYKDSWATSSKKFIEP